MADPRLYQIQSWFWQSISRQPGDDDFVPDLVEAIAASPELKPAERLKIYSDAYFLRLRDVLAEDFPRVARMLGQPEFERLVCDYLAADPSTEPSVRHLGRKVADFIRAREGTPAWLADLAALEWARVDAFDAPDDQTLTLAQLAELDPARWPQMQMSAVRSLKLLDAKWPVHRLWLEDEPAGVEPCAICLRVWRRPDFQVLQTPMDAYESAAVAMLLKGSSFAEICQVFDALDEQEGAQQAGGLLLRWLEDGIVAATQTNF
jgi:hypothetical protein